MQTLIPQPAQMTARPLGRAGRVLGFGLTVRALVLFGVGLVMAVPAFFNARQIVFLLVWDGLVLVLLVIDTVRLPGPERMTVQRRFLDSPQLGRATRVELGIVLDADAVVALRVVDDLHAALVAVPVEQRVEAYPREEVVSTTTVFARERGEFALGSVYLRLRGGFGLVERWAVAAPQQTVRVFPAHEDSGDAEFYLLRARQIEQQKRRLRLRGIGRDFESLREYQPGDELRNISWTATARRSHLVTRMFTVERSQQVWMVIDAGRLSRTAFALERTGAEAFAETSAERDRAHLLTVTQLDQATTAATMLAQVIQGSGDKFALMTYGRTVNQLLPPGAGASHLRLLIDLLSRTKSESAEADALGAMARLKTLQRRRGLVVWITELTDQAGRPELVTAASDLARRHLVVLVLLKHPELEALAARRPTTREEMFRSAAALEMLERRRETIARLERQGVLIVEATAGELGVKAVSKYLEIKAEGRL